MEKEKLQQILETMQGVTYFDWQKIKHAIDGCFTAESHNCHKNMTIASPGEVIQEYKKEFDITPRQSE